MRVLVVWALALASIAGRFAGAYMIAPEQIHLSFSATSDVMTVQVRVGPSSSIAHMAVKSESGSTEGDTFTHTVNRERFRL
jgi:hypothetical protein